MSTVREAASQPQQLYLFDIGVDVGRLRAACEVIMGANKAANTERAYTSAWRTFRKWCKAAGRHALPATEDTCLLWATDMLDQGKRIGTVRVKLSGIAARHVCEGLASPFGDKCRQFLANSARLKRERRQCKRAVTIEQLRKVVSLPQTRPLDTRNAAIFTLGFALGWRRSELSSLNLHDVQIDSRGAVVTLGASKTDQTGKGRIVAIPRTANATCPIAALETWLKLRGKFRGPLFVQMRYGLVSTNRLGERAICTIIQEMLAAIGEDATEYGAHSLRAGMITAAAEAGASEFAIMQRSGHRSIATVIDYIRPVKGFKTDALAGVL